MPCVAEKDRAITLNRFQPAVDTAVYALASGVARLADRLARLDVWKWIIRL